MLLFYFVDPQNDFVRIFEWATSSFDIFWRKSTLLSFYCFDTIKHSVFKDNSQLLWAGFRITLISVFKRNQTVTMESPLALKT